MATPTPTTMPTTLGAWFTVITAGRVATADAATITTVESTVTNSAHKVIHTENHEFDYVQLRLRYDPTLTGITSPIVKLFGRRRHSSTVVDAWQVLKNRAGNLSASLAATPATDAQDGGLAESPVDSLETTFHYGGCNEFVVGVETALAGGTGVTTTALVEMKLVCNVE